MHDNVRIKYSLYNVKCTPKTAYTVDLLVIQSPLGQQLGRNSDGYKKVAAVTIHSDPVCQESIIINKRENQRSIIIMYLESNVTSCLIADQSKCPERSATCLEATIMLLSN